DLPCAAMERLRLIALDETVVFPHMTVTLPIDVGEEARVFLVPRHNEEYARVGVVADVIERVKMRALASAVVVTGRHRRIAGAASEGSAGSLWVEVEPRPEADVPASRTQALEREFRAVVEEILELRGDDGRARAFVRSISGAGALADASGYSPDLSFRQKVALLETIDVLSPLEQALALQRERLAELQVRKKIRDDAESGAQKQQREYLLRKQLDSIRKELGEDDSATQNEYRRKIDEAGMPQAAREQAEREL